MATDFEALLAQCRGPLTFTAPMVLAVLDGRKTQTRRCVGDVLTLTDGLAYRFEWRGMRYENEAELRASLVAHAHFAVGDLAYVAEGLEKYSVEGVIVNGTRYRADRMPTGKRWIWKPRVLPSRSMPKALARRILHVDEVRAERVQDITEEQARTEGLGDEYDMWREEAENVAPPGESSFETCRDWFAQLWDSIHSKPPHDWASNPWVWVYRFHVEARR